jgi:hypothetical protein
LEGEGVYVVWSWRPKVGLRLGWHERRAMIARREMIGRSGMQEEQAKAKLRTECQSAIGQ